MISQNHQEISGYWKKWIGPSLASGVIKLSSMLVSLSIMVILGNNGGTTTLGLYALGQTCLQLLILFTGFGLPNYLSRQFSWSLASESIEDCGCENDEYFLSFLAVLVIGGGAAFVLFIGSSFFSDYFFHNALYTNVLRWVATALIPYTLVIMHTEIIRGFGSPILGQLLQSLLIPVLTLTCLGTSLLRHTSISASMTMSFYAYASYTSGLLSILYVWVNVIKLKNISSFRKFLFILNKKRMKSNIYKMHHILRKGGVFLIAGVALTLLSMTDTIMLGFLSSPDSVGKYNAASKIASSLSIVLFSVNNILAPKLGKSFASGDMIDFSMKVKTGISLSFWPTLLAGVGLLCFSPEILLIFGDGFENAAIILRILTVGALINALSGPVGWVLCMSGHEAVFQRVLLWAAGLNIILNLALIPAYGAVGSAIATSICTALWNVISAIIVSKKLGICCIYGCNRFLERVVNES